MRKFYKDTAHKGFTLLELLLSFAIILGAAIVAFYVYPKVKANADANVENNNLITLQAGIKTLFRSKSNFSGVSPRVAIDAMIAPSKMIADNQLVNSWKGQVGINAVNLNNLGSGGGADAFSISYSNVPAEACIKLALGTGSSFDAISIIGASSWIKAKISDEIDIEKVTTACKKGGQYNMMIFYTK